MPWIVKKYGKQVGKDYDTRDQALEAGVNQRLIVIVGKAPYYSEGVEIQYLQIEEEKQEGPIYAFDFKVRETLKRDRIYTIYAKNEDEAQDLLDGFKQKPEEAECSDEKIVVDDYYIIDVARSNSPIELKTYHKDSVEFRVMQVIKDACDIDMRFGKSDRSLNKFDINRLDILEICQKLEEEFSISLEEDNDDEDFYIDGSFSFNRIVNEIKKRLNVFRPEV